MGFTTLVYSVSLFWLILHAVRYLTSRKTHGPPSGLLPLPSSSQPAKRFSSTTKIVLRHASLRVETSTYNDAYDRLTLYLAKHARTRLRRVLFIFYDCGRIAGLAGMVIAISLLLVTVVRSASSLVNTAADMKDAYALPDTKVLGKRDMEPSLMPQHTPRVSHTNDVPLHLIIPGVTVPLSHLPMLLAALFITQVIHEAGHAICSAIDSVPLLSIGASLTVLIPSAFVSLSSAAVHNLPPRARMRIISAGAFHNLVYWMLLAFTLRMGFGQTIWSILGYDYVGHFGRVVIAVHEASPLHHSLPSDTVITSLDDLHLTSSDSSADLWTSYLSHASSSASSNNIGWCVDAEWFLAQDSVCCSTPHVGSNEACFIEMVPALADEVQRCAPTLSILHSNPVFVKRCTLTADCGDYRLCVDLKDDEELVRIGIWTPGSKATVAAQSDLIESDVVIWSGPREEILAEVQIGFYTPRYSWLPLGLPDYVEVFINYLMALTLSLYFFNLLPLPFLDGSQLLESFLDLSNSRNSGSPRMDIAMRDMEGGSSHPSDDRVKQSSHAWKKQLSHGVQILTGTLILMSILLGALQLRR